MSGTPETLRVAGITSGYPAEIDASVKVRYVAPLLINMSERSAGLLKYFGGPEKFQFNNTKIEWVEDDVWNRRLSHGGLAAGGTTALVVTGAAHRYPIGTILFNVPDGEYVRVTAHADADTLTIVRDIVAGVTEGAWASTDEVFVAGFAMDENDDYVYRPTSIFSLPYNIPQVHQAGVQASWRRLETALYGLRGSDLDMQAMNLVAEQFVAMEQSLVHGTRFAGSASVPAMMGGIKYYVTAANSADVTDLATAALTRKDIDDMFQDLYYAVGGEKMGLTLIVSAWAKRKIDSFFSGAERMPPGLDQAAGITVSRLNTAFGVADILLHPAIAKNEILCTRRETIQMGTHGQLGRPQLRELPPSQTGPRVQKVFYADVSCIVGGVNGMGRIHTFSTTS